jgi:hypothetical protein
MHIAKHGRGRDGIEVGFTTTYAISAYHSSMSLKIIGYPIIVILNRIIRENS